MGIVWIVNDMDSLRDRAESFQVGRGAKEECVKEIFFGGRGGRGGGMLVDFYSISLK